MAKLSQDNQSLSQGFQWNCSVQFSHSVVSNSLQPHGQQHTRPPSPSPTPGVYSNSCPLSQWCHPTISSSVIPFSSHLQSFPASGSFQMSQLFTSGGHSIGVSASASVLPMISLKMDWLDLLAVLLERGILFLLQCQLLIDSILKSRDITLSTKVCLAKAMVFPVVMYGCETWTIKKVEHRRIDVLNCSVGRDSWESLGLYGLLSAKWCLCFLIWCQV